jgi:type IV pilus assembly protein PilP
MKKNSAVAYTTTLVLVSVLWVGVSGSSGADPKGAEKKAAEPKAVEQKATEAKPVPQYSYNPAGKPDPFKPFIELDAAAKKKVEKAKPLPIFPLQRADIDEFKLVGISGDEQKRKAIVQDSKGKVYPVFIGTSIGLNNGRVVGILADRVIVEEKVKARAGKPKTNRITIKLHKEEGEGKP